MDSERSHRVLLIDDAEVLRMLLRMAIKSRNRLTVVGEAADGVEGVQQASKQCR